MLYNGFYKQRATKEAAMLNGKEKTKSVNCADWSSCHTLPVYSVYNTNIQHLILQITLCLLLRYVGALIELLG